METSYLKWGAVISFFVAMIVLIGSGYVIKEQLPPYPEKVISETGNTIFDRDAIEILQCIRGSGHSEKR
jgi:nitric oxide reductase large subunit